MLKNYFLITIRTLRQNPLYTALSVFGIAFTFVFVSALLLIVKSTNGDFIPPKYAERTWQVKMLNSENGKSSLITKELCETWIPKMKTPEIILVSNEELYESEVVNDKFVFFGAKLVNDNYFEVCRLNFLRGRPINRQEIIDAVPVAVIDRHISNQCFEKSEDPVGKTIELFGIQYKVVGIVETVSNFAYGARLTNANIWIPSKTVQKDVTYVISFTAKDKASVADMQAEFIRVLNETNTSTGAQYSIPVWGKKTVKQQSIGNILTITVCLILMLIPALNILSLNVSKSLDRSEEIAIRKTFGAPLSTIFGQLFFENCLLTLAGAVIGMCATPIILNAIDQMLLGSGGYPMTLSLHFDWTTILWIAGPCVLLFSFLSGSIPAYITAKREIVNVLKGGAQ